MNNDFNFFVPVEIEKAGKLDKDGYPEQMIVTGVASTMDEDTDGETLDPNGYNLDRFLKYGHLNLEHQAKNNPSFIVGEPIAATVKDNKLFIKGKLYKSSEKARAIWDTAIMLEKEGSSRKLGYSIEGKATYRDPNNEKRILKANITHCAITSSPKNVNSFLDIVKGNYEESYIESEFDESANGGAEYLLDITKPDGTRVTVDKEFNIKIDKAMSAGSGTGTDLTNQDTSGAALKTESLKEKLVNLQPNVKNAIKIISKKKHKLSDEIMKNVIKSIKSFLFS